MLPPLDGPCARCSWSDLTCRVALPRQYDIIVVMSHADAVYDVLRLVRPLVLSSARVVEAGTRPVGLTVGSRAVLEVLDATGPAPVPDVAERLDLPRQAVQRHVDELRRRGYVETRPNPAHRRSVLVTPTGDGTRVFRDLRAAEGRDLDEVALDCTAADLETARQVLAAILRDVRAREGVRS